ncbi:proline--tRNA ligase [Traorella massiliensis]|uniref:proline--tRNA ligase n=1 Tax=Traorella massiliensis TaxID=1903263 RepID=UPI0023561800|nr:proline--tRNA ligase [Traorella massiliensis]
MKLSESFFYTLRENAKDEESISGNLLVRAGMIKKTSNGIYMIMPMGKLVLNKIENIVREEMNATGAQELLMPTLIMEEVYEKSGRRENFGSNMFSLKDRYQKNYVLGPTHEELFTVAASMDGSSYKDFPYNLYQIQTKFRDETRPRYGLIRVREFIMKDAYSFDTDLEGLEVSYQKMFEAYKRIFDRLGITYKIVNADLGVMGGLLSEEFQAVCDIGEDVIVQCDACGFSSNLEVAPVIVTGDVSDEAEGVMEEVATPNAKTIDEVAAFMNTDASRFVKTLLYKVSDEFVAFLLKGNRELNETKALKLLNAAEMEMASPEDVEMLTHAAVGFAGPVGLENVKIVMDQEVALMKNFICGANKTDTHLKNVNLKDFKANLVGDIGVITEDDVCPCCGKKLSFTKGIEIGNTFKLGDKYSKAMGLNYLDANNQLHPVQMGCYGIGLGRCLAAVVEQHNDENGIIWPESIAPFEIGIVLISNKDEAQKKLSLELYDKLKKMGYDVLLDDRDERPGVKFKDMELIGLPYRITVGRKAAEGVVECTTRATSLKEEMSVEKLLERFRK